MAVASRHAKQRTKERLGLHKSISDKVAHRAMTEGIAHSQTSGSLRRYFDFLWFRNKNADNIRVYNYNVFIFDGEILVTIFPLPQKYRKTYENIKKKVENNDSTGEQELNREESSQEVKEAV